MTDAVGASWVVGVAVALGVACSGTARAAEVLWLNEPLAEDAARVAALARARRGPLGEADFRALLTRAVPRDARLIDDLARVREEVRAHEAVLDGERLIIEALDRALEPVALVRDERDRETVQSALLYQGFAVDRYWGPTLADDPAAAPYRQTIDDVVVEQPWVDAFALDPLRRVSDRDIGEAPSREAYDALRQHLARTLRARVLAPDLPSQSILFIDGSPAEIGEATVLEVLPGRHWMHVELGGQVIGRAAVRLEPGQRFEVAVPLPEEDWERLVRAARKGAGVVPTSVVPYLEAVGGELWIARGRGDDLYVAKVTVEGITSVDASPRAETGRTSGGALSDVALDGWVGPGVIVSSDFAAEPPTGREGGPVALAPTVGLELGWTRGWLRYGLGVELFTPVGAAQVALSGAASYRVRAVPYVVLGHPRVQATFGYLFPHHWVGGAQGSAPLVQQERYDLTLRGGLRVGAGSQVARPDGTVWQSAPLLAASVGLGISFRP